jgi:hypothetical protein
VPIDSFSQVMPYAYETWKYGHKAQPSFSLILALGPNLAMDEPYNAPNTLYDASNGTRSRGDVLRSCCWNGGRADLGFMVVRMTPGGLATREIVTGTHG